MPRSLTIFIDGLPHGQLDKMKFARSFASRGRLVPTLGYSVNCQTQLFTGQSPDEVGFWCEWTYDPDASPFRPIRSLLPLLALAERWYPAERITHRILDKIGPVSCTKNIPLNYLADFAETGRSALERGFEHPSLLDTPNLTKFLHWQFEDGPRRDAVTCKAVKDHIEGSDDLGSVLATFYGIDYCSHVHGVDSEPYDALLEESDTHIRELTEAYLSRVPDGVVFVASDHGMSNIEHQIRIDLEGHFGRPRKGRYHYFAEGTILRVWCAEDALRDEISAYLSGFEGLEQLPDEERKAFGLTNPKFGDLIFHTHEGYQLVPSFWGPIPSRGMHGHHPRYPSQHGICLSTREGDFDGEFHAAEFYSVLSECLQSNGAT